MLDTVQIVQYCRIILFLRNFVKISFIPVNEILTIQKLFLIVQKKSFHLMFLNVFIEIIKLTDKVIKKNNNQKYHKSSQQRQRQYTYTRPLTILLWYWHFIMNSPSFSSSSRLQPLPQQFTYICSKITNHYLMKNTFR